MASIPLEDSFVDIIGKAQRGLKLSDDALVKTSGITSAQLEALRAANMDEQALRKLAVPLRLGAQALVDSARKTWYPPAIQVEGLLSFNTVYEDMTVNSYLAYDPKTKQAVVFDTGADASPMLEAAQKYQLRIGMILLTHTHGDHIADLAKLQSTAKVPVYVHEREPVPGADVFKEGRAFTVGGLRIESRRTSGHSVGGVTYVVSGLTTPIAVVGDAIFAGSMGGGAISWSDALENNRRQIFTLADATVLCPGHGPLSRVEEEKKHNPVYPEFQT
jgi:glyoxylase-like metal-dependent hydrolase (beta-lactamase superfamily II)